ncbi:MAG: acetate--CoA ligase family protein, partial [Proteobacteria bacterium]|nr:acetate--CoA ligase family protein [Pseudomonadota bacterium]
NATIQGVSVQKMAKPGTEVIVGTSKDPQFGPVIMFGLGGIFVEVLKDVSFRIIPLSRKDALEMIEEIKGAGEKASALTNQLLAFSRKQILQPEVINLNGIVKDMGNMLCRIIGENIKLRTELASDLGQVEADAGQIEQVIMNLCVNARDAMPMGGNLTIETKNVELDEDYANMHIRVMPGPYVMLAVSDSGFGIAREVQPHIFEPFFTTKDKSKGTGLGLSTVYGIVKQSNGNIWVYSEPGKGTAFKIYLPRCEEASITPKKGEIREEVLHGSETVLLVEDDEMVRNLAL